MTYKTISLPARSTKETREYAQAIEKGMHSYFVIQNGKGWYVRKASSKVGDAKLFDTKSQAIKHATNYAAKKNAEVLVFSNKGSLLSRKSA